VIWLFEDLMPGNVVIRFGSQHPALERIDPNTAFLYAPHTVSTLLLGMCCSSSTSLSVMGSMGLFQFTAPSAIVQGL
jgi:hypothetical protein